MVLPGRSRRRPPRSGCFVRTFGSLLWGRPERTWLLQGRRHLLQFKRRLPRQLLRIRPSGNQNARCASGSDAPSCSFGGHSRSAVGKRWDPSDHFWLPLPPRTVRRSTLEADPARAFLYAFAKSSSRRGRGMPASPHIQGLPAGQIPHSKGTPSSDQVRSWKARQSEEAIYGPGSLQSRRA
jgi:hypothetical protein